MPQNVQICGACCRRYRPEARGWAGEPAGLRSGGNVPSLPQGNTLCGRAHGRNSGESQPPILGRPLGKFRPWATKGELQQTRRASTLDVMVPGHVKAPRPKGCAVGCCTCRLGAAAGQHRDDKRQASICCLDVESAQLASWRAPQQVTSRRR